MRQFWLLLFIAPFLFLSCSEDNQTPESPADADDNFITSVVMTVASQSYTAEIIDNIITITVPYTVSLNNAQVDSNTHPRQQLFPIRQALLTGIRNERFV